MIVLDVSVAAPMVLPDEPPVPAELMRLLLDTTLIAPAHWPLEALNMLLSAERRRRLTAEGRERAAQYLQQLNITIVGAPERTWHQVQALAVEHKLTAYDAVYLELAIARGASLATLDGELIAAARRIGIGLVTF